MLRIITDRHGPAYRLHLHGTLAGEWIDVLERHWHAVVRNGPPGPVTVVVSDVTFIDPAAEPLLRRMADAGVAFEGGGIMNRYVIDKISG